jgi:hypothetical protein
LAFLARLRRGNFQGKPIFGKKDQKTSKISSFHIFLGKNTGENCFIDVE